MSLKVTINGEVFSFEPRYSVPDGIALEEGLGMTFGAFLQGTAAGSAKALAGLAWLVLTRNGRDVPLADILSGEYDLDLADIRGEPEGDDADPTPPSSPPTGDGTSESSLRSSDTGQETSISSQSTSSTT